jgi:hypothetical protein
MMMMVVVVVVVVIWKWYMYQQLHKATLKSECKDCFMQNNWYFVYKTRLLRAEHNL